MDKDGVITIDHHTAYVSPAAKASESGAGNEIIVLDDSEELEVRSKLGRTSADSASQGAANSIAGGNSKEEENRSALFYLTKVRGIGTHHNRSNVAVGIKGKL